MNSLVEMRSGLERVLIQGDLSKLSEDQRLNYVRELCECTGLNILTRPFDYINFQGKLTLYARKEAADQLRQIHKISINLSDKQILEGIYLVSAKARDPNGREDEATGAIFIDGLKGLDRANAMMKGETKAKRRVTLSICGLGILDESEIENVRDVSESQSEEKKEEIPFQDDLKTKKINELVGKFKKLGVTEQMITQKFNLESILALTSDHMSELSFIGQEILNKRLKVPDAFKSEEMSF